MLWLSFVSVFSPAEVAGLASDVLIKACCVRGHLSRNGHKSKATLPSAGTIRCRSRFDISGNYSKEEEGLKILLEQPTTVMHIQSILSPQEDLQ